MTEHGTARGFRQHRLRGERPCLPCYDAEAERQRNRRAAHRRPRVLAPCGTPAAYRRHLRHGETPCGACRAAHAADVARYARGAA